MISAHGNGENMLLELVCFIERAMCTKQTSSLNTRTHTERASWKRKRRRRRRRRRREEAHDKHKRTHEQESSEPSEFSFEGEANVLCEWVSWIRERKSESKHGTLSVKHANETLRMKCGAVKHDYGIEKRHTKRAPSSLCVEVER